MTLPVATVVHRHLVPVLFVLGLASTAVVGVGLLVPFLACAALVFLSGITPSGLRRPEVLVGGLIIAWTLLALAWNRELHLWGDLFPVAKLLLPVALLSTILALSPDSRWTRGPAWLAAATLAGSALVAIAAAWIQVALGQVESGYVAGISDMFRLTGFRSLAEHGEGALWFFGYFRSHSAAGGWLALTLLAVAALFVGQRMRFAWRLALLPVLGLLGAHLLLSHSRNGMLGASLGLGCLAAWDAWAAWRTGRAGRIRLGRWAMLGLALLFAAIPMRWVVAQRFVVPLQTMHDGAHVPETKTAKENPAAFTATERLRFWRVAIASIAVHPLVGTGTASFGSVGQSQGAWQEDYVGTPRELIHAHNSPLMIWTEQGLIGLGLWTIWWILLVRRCMGWCRLRRIRVAGLIGVTALISVHGMSIADHCWGSPAVMMPLILLLGWCHWQATWTKFAD